MDGWAEVEDKEVTYITPIWWDVCPLSIKNSHQGKRISLSCSVEEQIPLLIVVYYSARRKTCIGITNLNITERNVVSHCAIVIVWIFNSRCRHETVFTLPSGAALVRISAYTPLFAPSTEHAPTLNWSACRPLIPPQSFTVASGDSYHWFSLFSPFLCSLTAVPRNLSSPDRTMLQRRALKERLDCLGVFIPHFFILLGLCTIQLNIPTHVKLTTSLPCSCKGRCNYFALMHNLSHGNVFLECLYAFADKMFL